MTDLGLMQTYMKISLGDFYSMMRAQVDEKICPLCFFSYLCIISIKK